MRVALKLLEDGQHAQAEVACRQLVAFDCDDIEALLLLALAIGMRGDVDAAAPLLNRVGQERRAHAHPCTDLARMLLRGGDAARISPQYLACLRATPDDLRLRYAYAEHLRERGEATQAIAVLDPVLRTHPASAEAHYQTGMALAEAARFDDAADRFRDAIRLDPGPAAFWSNLGTMLKIQGRFDEALDAYAQALARAPTDRQIRVNRAVARLHAGRFAEAWQDEDWVLAEPGRVVLPAQKLLPPLSVLPDLTGRTVLVVQEEGFGDTLQFLRYLPLLANRGARVAVAVPPELTRLMRTVPAWLMCPPAMRRCRNTTSTARSTDFRAPSRRRWRPFRARCRISWPIRHSWPIGRGDCQRPRRCASVWCGRVRRGLAARLVGLDRRRSTDLATLAPLAAVSGVEFVSLQKGGAAPGARTPADALDLHDVMAEVRDFADTAAIVANLDLVISVDTSVVHLAGAMGKPVFLLDRYDNCWRWLSGRDDSPWYPGLRIFRQGRPGEWAPVIARVAAALGTQVALG